MGIGFIELGDFGSLRRSPHWSQLVFAERAAAVMDMTDGIFSKPIDKKAICLKPCLIGYGREGNSSDARKRNESRYLGYRSTEQLK